MPTHIFTWKYPTDKEVTLYGSFNNWSYGTNLFLDASNKLIVPIVLDSGTHYYKFKVGDEWCYDICEPTQTDPNGNVNNVIILL